MADNALKNPWIGLESYSEGEILYGRDDDIRDLIQAVLNDVDTLLYGKSGIGKSSILKAGIFPAARRNGYLPVMIRLSHKEDDDYLSQIKHAIILAMGISDSEDHEIDFHIREVVKRKGSSAESLFEFFHRHTFHDKNGDRIKLLIVFDQFEEIFTLQEDESKKRTFFTQLADLLNDIMPDELQSSYIGMTRPSELVKRYVSNPDDVFDEIDIDFKEDISEYVSDNEVHFVFAIREDFLSDLEFYSSSIPSLKQNRYGLRPINGQQALQVILHPRPGLISQSVAKLILKKVTDKADFNPDELCGIEVDSAVLSLYMNRLYESKGKDGITAGLIEQKGDEIISDFYNDAIAEISESSLIYLEEKLINGQGRRDNITIYDAIHKGGLSLKELNILCEKRKILRQFNYAGVLRIEYIHDILCPIVTKNRDFRVQRKLVEEESRKLIEQQALHTKKLKRRNRLILLFASLTVIVLAVLLFVYVNQPKLTKFTVLLTEDDSINMTEYWKARVAILSGSDTLCVEDVDKSNPMFTFDVKDVDPAPLICDVNFLIGDLTNGVNTFNFTDDGYNVIVPISHNSKRTLVKGKVASCIGSKAPIYNAIVIIDDQLAKTNYKGEFFMYVDSVLQDSTIIIRKKGYKYYEGKLQAGTYRLDFKGRYEFPDMAEAMHKRLDKANDLKTLEGYMYGFKNKDTVRGKSHMILGLAGDSIFGYSYYDKLYNMSPNKINSYFIINGKYNPVNNTFKLHFMDAVYNEIEYTGHISKDSIWYGEAFDKNTNLGYFIFE